MKTYSVITICILLLLSCQSDRKSYVHKKTYWEIEDSIRQAKEEVLNEKMQKKRKEVNKQMLSECDFSVVGNISLGDSKTEYKKHLNEIHSAVGYDGVKFGNVTLMIQNAEFYQDKLYSLQLSHSYIYGSQPKKKYNDREFYDPTTFIAPVVDYFENKYGMPDSKVSHDKTVRGQEEARVIVEKWVFPCKRITISNDAAEFGGGLGGAEYTLSITIDSPQIVQEVSDCNKKKAEEAEKRWQERQKRQKKAENDLLNTL